MATEVTLLKSELSSQKEISSAVGEQKNRLQVQKNVINANGTVTLCF